MKNFKYLMVFIICLISLSFGLVFTTDSEIHAISSINEDFNLQYTDIIQRYEQNTITYEEAEEEYSQLSQSGIVVDNNEGIKALANQNVNPRATFKASGKILWEPSIGSAFEPLRNVKVELWHRDTMGQNNYLKTTYTDYNGDYNFTYSTLFGDIHVYIKVYAESTTFRVARDWTAVTPLLEYILETPSTFDTSLNNRLNLVYSFEDSDRHKAFSVSQGMAWAQRYAIEVGGMDTSKKLNVVYGSHVTTTSFCWNTFSGINTLDFKSLGTLLHEYGHFVSGVMGNLPISLFDVIINNKDFGHSGNEDHFVGKDKQFALDLSWMESWASAFALMAYNHFSGIYRANASMITETTRHTRYDPRTDQYGPDSGEAQELTVISFLWDLFGARNSNLQSDKWTPLGDSEFWRLSAQSETYTLMEFVNRLNNQNPQFCNEIGTRMGFFKIAPSNLILRNNPNQFTLPSFNWRVNGSQYNPNNQFRLAFYDSNGIQKFETGNVAFSLTSASFPNQNRRDFDIASYTLSSYEWEKVLTLFSDLASINVAVKGYLNSSPLSGPYSSSYLIIPISFPILSFIPINNGNEYSISNLENKQYGGAVNIPTIYNGKVVTEIGAKAFENSMITSLIIPDTVTSIGGQAFANCNKLNITVSPSNPSYSAEGNILYNKDKTILFAACKINSEVNIPNTVIVIAPYAFAGNNNLYTLRFGNNTPILSEYAFTDCINLASVYFYSYDIPNVAENCFSENNFVIYTPYVCQESYGELFAKYINNIDSIKAKVFFNSDGATINTWDVYYGSIICDLIIPVKTGFDFYGWYDNPAFNGAPYQNGGLWERTENLNLYAKFEAKEFYILFAGEQSNGLEPKKVKYNSLIGDLPSVTMVGYQFLGWKAQSGDYYNNNMIWQGLNNITLTSDWSANTYKVTLEPKGGSINGDNTFSVKYNSSITTSSVATRSGYTLEGWYDSGNIKYLTSSGESTRLWDKTSDAILYAKWAVKSYEIQIKDKNNIIWLGARGLSDEQCSIEYGTVLNAINLIASFKQSNHGFKEGNVFDHFEYDGANVEWKSIPDLGKNGAIITIIPIWVLEFHTIYFNTLSAETLDKIEANYDTPIQLPISARREGYTFMGWYTNSTGGTKVTWTRMPELTPDSQNNGSITLFARWDNNTYYVNYFANEALGTMNPSTHKYEVEQNLNKNVFTKLGNNFVGWAKSPNGAVEFVNEQNVKNLTTLQSGNVQLYAKWAPKTFNISLDKQGGTGGTSSVTATYGASMPLDNTAPTKTGYTFQGFYSLKGGGGIKYYNANMTSANNWTTDGAASLYAHWAQQTYKIVLDKQGGSGGNDNITATYDSVLPSASGPSRLDWNFEGYYSLKNGEGIKYYNAYMKSDVQWNIAGETTLYAHWTAIKYFFTIRTLLSTGESNTINTFYLAAWEYKSVVAPDINGYNFKGWKNGPRSFQGQYYVSFSSSIKIELQGKIYNIYGENIFTAEYDKACVAEGSLITLADGSRKAVETLTGDEMLLVWNLKTGAFDTAPILFIDSDPAKSYEVINLYFSDGTTVKVISEHAFWDINLNKYVFLRNDAEQYIGHWFNKQSTDESGNHNKSAVQLTNVIIANEITSAWSPVTAEHLCYYVNGMLSMPGGTTGLINIFAVDPNTMHYDKELMQADIEEYGLFTYEEFVEIIEIPEDIFLAFNVQYFKVAIGKGLITMEGIIYLIQTYEEFLNAL